MYIPQPFNNDSILHLHQFIERYNFATLVSHAEKIQVTHIPVMLKRDEGRYGMLTWHMAKLNTHHQLLHNQEVLFIFHGPHSYISPAWYKHYPSVPTWNYAVVHVSGVPEIMNQDQLANELTEMVEYHESQLNITDKYSVPKGYKTKLLEHIVGFQMEIREIKGKFKLNQNHSKEDQQGVIEGLRNTETVEAIALADFMEELEQTSK